MGEPLPHPRAYACPRAKGPVHLDGDLSKSVWEASAWSEPFLDIEGLNKPPPVHLTRMKMLWDDTYLYVGAYLDEPHVWATLTERDSVIFQDNDFEIFLDPDGDHHAYLEVEINALGTVWDLLLTKPYRDGGKALTGYDLKGLRTAVMVRGTLNDPTDIDDGWGVEIALPWASLQEFAGVRCPPEPGDRWRINFSRVQWDLEVENGHYRKRPNQPEHNWVWSPQWAIDMHRPEWWGYVEFVTDSTTAAPDPEWPMREKLMRLYHAQHAFRRIHGRWASLAELNLDEDIELHMGESTFEAVLRCELGRFALREDSRLIVDRT